MKILKILNVVTIISCIVIGYLYAEEVQQAVEPNQNSGVSENITKETVTTQPQGDSKETDASKKGEVKKDSGANEDAVVVKNEVREKEKRVADFVYREFNSFGINISSHSGLGLSYRYHTEAPYLLQITGGVISSGKSYYYAVGGEIQRELSKSKDKRAFGSLAVGLYGERYEETDRFDIESKKWVLDTNFALAVGVGGEIALGASTVDAISLGVEIYPIGMYLSGSGGNDFKMFPGGSLYLFYNF